MTLQADEPPQGEGSEQENFDLEQVLADFLADASQKELQLPHMTTGQRKQAKSIADKYPEIKCKSYGCGAERKLYFFKVDDCSSPQAAISASGNASLSASPSAAPEIRVRNTFIHVEETGPVDERVVRSMPHGMFSKCWQEETMGQAANGPTSRSPEAASLPPEEAPKDIFPFGSEVVIERLTKFPAFNGLRGTVQSLDAETGRYNVLLVSHDGSAGQCAKIKSDNLRLTVPPPPPFESTACRPAESMAPAPAEIPIPCVAMPVLPQAGPGTPVWQELHNHQMHYDQGNYDPYGYTMLYPAR